MIANLLHNCVYVLIIVGFAYIAKLLADIRTRNIDDDNEIEEKSNLAIGIRRGGLYLGIFIGLAGALIGGTKGFIPDLKELVIDGAALLVLMFAVREINDRFILRGVNNDEEAKNKNVAVGLVEAGSYIAMGLVLNGSFAGAGGGVGSAIVFAILGQVALMVLFILYQNITPFDVVSEVKENNIAAGTAVCGNLIALGVVLRASIAGPFVSWTADLFSFLVSAAIGIIALIALRAIIDLLFLPHTTLATEVKRDKNVAALVVTEALIVGSAFVIATVV